MVLTGSRFRISDALELLAAGHGKRLLISGVYPATKLSEIAHMMPEFDRWFACCVDLDHLALNTIGNAVETKRWAREQGSTSLIVVTSNFHMPRAMAEIAHQLAGRQADGLSGGVGSRADRTPGGRARRPRGSSFSNISSIWSRWRACGSTIRLSLARPNDRFLPWLSPAPSCSTCCSTCNLIVLLIAAIPTLLLPPQAIIEMAKLWGRTSLWLLRVVCGTRSSFAGSSGLPPGPLIVAAKHQSTWETFALLSLFKHPIFIVKRELMWIPLFGWFMWKGRMIAVDRGSGSQALAGDDDARARGDPRRPPALHLSGRHAPRRPAPSRDTSSAWRISMT